MEPHFRVSHPQWKPLWLYHQLHPRRAVVRPPVWQGFAWSWSSFWSPAKQVLSDK
jgi:hypothetical protein